MDLDPALQATRDYVTGQVAIRDMEGLIALVEAETGRFHAAARAAGPGASDGEWTSLQAVAHLVARSMLRAREVLFVALGGELPSPDDAQLPGDVEGLLRVHREAIDSLYEHVRAANDLFLGITWEHPAFGPWNWKEWLVFISVHTADHAQQLERMDAQS
jgi:hypothetical protein